MSSAAVTPPLSTAVSEATTPGRGINTVVSVALSPRGGPDLKHGKVNMSMSGERHAPEKKEGWQAGDCIEVLDMINTVEMNGSCGLLEKYDAKSGKWVCHVYV